MARRWECLEVGCGTAVTAASDEELVAAVNAHVREAHDLVRSGRARGRIVLTP